MTTLRDIHTPIVTPETRRLGEVVVAHIMDPEPRDIRVWVSGQCEECAICAGWAYWVEDRRGGRALCCVAVLHTLH